MILGVILLVYWIEQEHLPAVSSQLCNSWIQTMLTPDFLDLCGTDVSR